MEHVRSVVSVFLAFLLLQCSSSVANIAQLFDGETVTISLENYDNLDKNEQAFHQLVTLSPNIGVVVRVSRIPSDVSFVVAQIHAYQYNVTLSYGRTQLPHTFAVGANVGLVLDVEGRNFTDFYVKNDNIADVQALLAVVAYRRSAPVPGGCNMEFDMEVAPYQQLLVSDSIVSVSMQQASMPKVNGNRDPCKLGKVQHEMYHLFLPEQDYSMQTYFEALTNSLTIDGIRTNGRKMPSSGSMFRRVYSAYRGTGSLYAAIAIFGNNSAAYVSAVTYACSPLYWTDTCEVLTSTFSKILCAVIFFLGCFTTFLGHEYFKTETFLLGFLSGGLVGYIMMAICSNNGPGTIGASVISGFFTGFAWLGIWWLFAVPLLSILLAGLSLGFLWSCILYFSSPAGIPYFENDVIFWVLAVISTLAVAVTVTAAGHNANIICCAILGSYAIVIPIDHYVGSSLKYIIVNMVRRATSPKFNVAIIDPPYQSKDIWLTFLWITLAVMGTLFQLRRNRGKPPFPPAMPNSPARQNLSNERTPLLVESRIPIVTLGSNDDVFESPNHTWYRGIREALKSCGRRSSNT